MRKATQTRLLPGISRTGASLGSTRSPIIERTSTVGSGGVSESLGASGVEDDGATATSTIADTETAASPFLPSPPPSSPSAAAAAVPVEQEATALPPPPRQPSPRGAAPPILRKREGRKGKRKKVIESLRSSQKNSKDALVVDQPRGRPAAARADRRGHRLRREDGVQDVVVSFRRAGEDERKGATQ